MELFCDHTGKNSNINSQGNDVWRFRIKVVNYFNKLHLKVSTFICID